MVNCFQGEDSGTLELWTDTPVLEAHAFAANTTEMHCEVPGILGMLWVLYPPPPADVDPIPRQHEWGRTSCVRMEWCGICGSLVFDVPI